MPGPADAAALPIISGFVLKRRFLLPRCKPSRTDVLTSSTTGAPRLGQGAGAGEGRRQGVGVGDGRRRV